MKLIYTLIAATSLSILTAPANASWFSEITGVDIDLNRGKVSVKTPNLGAIPQMLQNLPKDVGQAMLNPAAPVLASAIRFSRGQALNRGTQQIPQNIKLELAPYFPSGILDKVRWTTADGVSIDGALKNWFNQEGAVTLDEIIVFSSQQLANNTELWAHELTHVLQYNQMGVETFAFQYLASASSMEMQATQNARQIIASISSTRSGQAATWALETKPGSGLQGQQIAWSQINALARQAIDPIQCIWIDNSTNTTGNSCPVPIRVSGVIIRRFDGFTFTSPCNEPTCIFQPNQRGPLLSPQGTQIIGVTAAYQN